MDDQKKLGISENTLKYLDIIHCLIEINDGRFHFTARTRAEHARCNAAREKCIERGWLDSFGGISPAGEQLLTEIATSLMTRSDPECIPVILSVKSSQEEIDSLSMIPKEE